MPVDRKKLGERMKYQRSLQDLSQEALAEIVEQSRVNIARIENGDRLPSVDVLVKISNALHVSVDDLLVDSLEYPISTADSELHRLLLDCNKLEEEILTRTAEELKKILYGLGI
nr:helix-turn-helix transcriptional regulator [Clostridia bacterium]